MPIKEAKSKATKQNDELTVQEQKNLVLAVFFDLLENDQLDEFKEFCQHAGLDFSALPNCSKCLADQLPNWILGHYRISKGRYDVDRVANDLATYPPIVARVEELRKEQAENSRMISKKRGK